jgi:hypothetical protein
LKRPDKALHCREIGITHFIDDRTDVLEAMVGIVSNLYLFGPQRVQAARGMLHLSNWKEVALEVL